MEPHIIKAVLTNEGRVVDESKPCVIRQVVRPEVAALVRDMMKDIPVDGTGRKAAVAEFPVAGKTGTAQKVVPGIPGYAPGKSVASFAGFAPADDPGLVILVVIDEPKGRGLGGDAAAPVFRRIVERVVRSSRHELVLGRRNARPASESTTCSLESDGSGLAGSLVDEAVAQELEAYSGAGYAPVALSAGGSSGDRLIVPASFSGVVDAAASDCVEMPDLVGMSLRRARRTAAGLGLVLSFDGTGLVQSQSPRMGSAVSVGDRVRVECR